MAALGVVVGAIVLLPMLTRPLGALSAEPALVLGGPVAMAIFFRFSCWLMDVRSLARRPGYQQVVDEVSAMVPWPPKA